MKRNLFIFIGGSDEQNGDYSLVQRLARRGGTTNWSSLKGARPGDRALIYIQSPHSALVAKAEVLAKPVKGKPGDYAYRVKLGRFELLPNRVSIQDMKGEFPRWAWLRYPRGKAVVPDRYARRLWKLVYGKQSVVQILISNAGYGKRLVERLAASEQAAFWSAPKLTAEGDTVLFYVENPVSAVVAVGKAMSPARVTSRKWYEAKVGNVRLLDAPIMLAELRAMFPDWAWLRSVNMFAYVSPERAKALLKRCALTFPAARDERTHASGGGFGDAETNAIVERAAVRKATHVLKRRGFRVRSRESERIGYDLDATRGRTELHVEVKGVSGDGMQFLITKAELAKAESDSLFRLMVVTRALTRNASVHEFRGRSLQHRFVLTPVSYFAEQK
jgi:predicted transcriptional regulator